MIAPLDTLSGAALQALSAGVVDTSAFALVVYLANAVARPSAATRHKLWWIVIVLAVAVPLASFSASLGRVRTISRPQAAVPVANATIPTIATVRSHAAFPAAVRANVAPRLDVTIDASAIVATLLALWLGIALVKHVGLFTELRALGCVKRRAIPLPATQTALLGAWRANSGARRSAVLAVSSEVDVPCAAGLSSPAILLPASVAASATSADIDRIAMHEFAHLWRFDDWTNLAERIVGATLWFNPAIALAKRRIAIDREIACDDWVVARTGGAHGYASCLFRLAEASLAGKAPTHALGALGHSRTITSRIEHLLASSHAPRRFTRTLPVAATAVAFAVVLGQAMRAPAIAVEAPAAIVSPAPAPLASAIVPPAIAPQPSDAPSHLPVDGIASSAPAMQTLSEPSAKPLPKAMPTGAKRVKPKYVFFLKSDAPVSTKKHAKKIFLTVVSDDPAAPLPPLPPASHLAKRKIVFIRQSAPLPPNVPNVPAMPAVPAVPAIPAIPPAPAMPRIPDEEIDAAAARLSAAATRVAEHALERAGRNEARDDRTQRLADEAEERAAERRMRDATSEIGRDHIRAALETVRRSERIRKDAIENALRSVRESLEPEKLAPSQE